MEPCGCSSIIRDDFLLPPSSAPSDEQRSNVMVHGKATYYSWMTDTGVEFFFSAGVVQVFAFVCACVRV